MGQVHSTPPWSVEKDNWLEKVKKDVAKSPGNWTGFSETIWPNPDPARGCRKEYTSTYQCAPGTTEKQVFIPASADGHIAYYDCNAEWYKCARAVLEILDTGEVILRNNDNTEVFWRSGPNKTGLPIETFSAAKSKYGRNYMEAGESLAVGEWVGSPSGNCYLTVVSDGSTSQFVVAYQELACHPDGKEPEGLGKDGYITTESGMGAFYSMSQGTASNKYAGQVAYSDINMHRRVYPNNMIQHGEDFIKLAGNFTQLDGIAKTMAGDFDACKTECNNMEHCEGLITSKDDNGGNVCTVLNSAYPNVGRIPTNGADTLYVRKAKVDNPMSCSGDVEATYGATFANQIPGFGMTPKTKCSLGEMTADQMKLVNAARKKLQVAADNMAGDLSTLNQQNATLDKDMLDQLGQLQKDSKQFDNVLDKTRELKKEIGDATGMEENSGLDMVSNNMQLVLWTALGAAAVIGSIKATK